MAGKPSLLIVGDEAGVLLTLQLLFEDAGYLVATAENAAQALQARQIRYSHHRHGYGEQA